MNKLYSVAIIDMGDSNPYKTWIFDDKKTAYIYLCDKYEKAWKKYHIPDSEGECDVVDEKCVYPFVDGYKNNDFVTGEYYDIYFKDNSEVVFGICQITPSHIESERSNISKDYLSWVSEDLKEAFELAEQMIKNPDEITLGDMIWLCRTVGMGKEILNAKEGAWLDVVEDALRKLGYRI